MIFRVHSNLKNTRRGFTLIEILVVIAIIGILSSVVLASLAVSRAKARDAKRIADLDEVKKALELYYDSHGQYPPSAGYSIPTVLATEGFIAKIPVTPNGANAYGYYGGTFSGNTIDTSLASESFILGAQLERYDATALTSDGDNRAILVPAIAGFFEGTSVSCSITASPATPQPGGGSNGERCYDTRP